MQRHWSWCSTHRRSLKTLRKEGGSESGSSEKTPGDIRAVEQVEMKTDWLAH